MLRTSLKYQKKTYFQDMIIHFPVSQAKFVDHYHLINWPPCLAVKVHARRSIDRAIPWRKIYDHFISVREEF